MFEFGKFKTSAWVLIGVNLVPLVGVFLWDWSVFEIVALYWLENVMLGGINVLKMITCSPKVDEFDLLSRLSEKQKTQLEAFKKQMGGDLSAVSAMHHGSKLFLIPFFTFHYGMFCFVHGVFVFALLGGEGRGVRGVSSPFDMVSSLGGLLQGAMFFAAAGLAGSHLFSFAKNYLGSGENRRTILPQLMMAPYGRIVVLHIAIIFGAFAVMALGSPAALLAILVGGKIMLDLKFHLREHGKLEVEDGG